MAADTSSMSTSGWMKFFCNAGIPSVVAGNYAVLFTKHRMHMDMLSDLSMEILNAIGINVMGDVIAILKHAKELHTQVTREKALASEDVPVSVHQTRANVPQNRVAVVKKNKILQANAPSQSDVQTKSAAANKRTIISLKRNDSTEEVPVQKIRRVLPEHEGPYTIKMPMGATAKTRRLLAQQGIATKKSVFDRLGESKVSSTTGNGSDGTKITITSFGRSVVDSSTNKIQNSSVFDRLGPSRSQVTSTSTEDDETIKKEPSLPYQGVLKPLRKPVIKIMSQQGIRTAEATSTSRNLAQDNIEKKISIMSRLGSNVAQSIQTKPANNSLRINPNTASLLAERKIISSSAKSDGILATGIKTKKISVLSRLGQKRFDSIDNKMISSPLIRVIKKKIANDNKIIPGQKTVLLRKMTPSGNVKKVRIVKKPKIHSLDDSLDMVI